VIARVAIALALALAIAPAAARADQTPTLVHAEVDPLPFANRGYGAQLGIRPAALRGVRVAIASFSLHVPDLLSQIGNDGFDERVRPSGAIYILYYRSPPRHDGWSFGGSLRYLRLRFEHDDFPNMRAELTEISPEAIVGYQWHPFHNGFYLQPWLALGIVLHRSGEPKVGDRTYDELPISPFFTVNIGWERGL